VPEQRIIVEHHYRRPWGCGSTFVAILVVGSAIVYWPVTVSVLGVLLVGLIVAKQVIRARRAAPPQEDPGGAAHSDRR
jgi:hypothetical protein